MFPKSNYSVGVVSAEGLIQFCDWAYWTGDGGHHGVPERYNDGDIVYCHTDQVFELFRKIRSSRNRVVLVTNESDHAVSERHFASRPWNVVEWFGANATANHSRCHVIPRGLANRSCQRTAKPEELVGEILCNERRPKWLYVNHRIETNIDVRKPIYTYFQKMQDEPWITVREPNSINSVSSYLEELKQHRFICCPPGNGIDTHRMWEALYTQTIPIVLRNRVTEAFSDLPMVVVDRYEQVTLPFLQYQYEILRDRQFAWEKLEVGYWQKQFLAAKARALATPRWKLIVQWLQRKLR